MYCPQFWKLEAWNQDVIRAMFSLKALGKDIFLFLPSGGVQRKITLEPVKQAKNILFKTIE